MITTNGQRKYNFEGEMSSIYSVIVDTDVNALFTIAAKIR
jgi:hypothetical protein